MTLKDTIKKYEWVLIPLLLIVAAFFGGDYYGQRKVENSLVSKTDTITKIVPVYKDFPDPVATASVGFIPIPTYAFVTDTVTNEHYVPVHDTTTQYVYVEREQKYYEEDEGRLRLWISGYDPRLDRYELDHVEKVVTNTVVEKASRWGLSLTGGYGAAYYDKRVILAPYVGVGITYTFLRF